MVRAPRQAYINPFKSLRFFTTLAFWLRSSVVSVLNSLTTIMEAPPPFTGYLIFAAPVFRALLATWRHDDLAIALLACVVGGSLFSHLMLLSVGANWCLTE